MRNNLRAITLLVLALAVFSTNAHAQYKYRHRLHACFSKEFLLGGEELHLGEVLLKKATHNPSGSDSREIWQLCLRGYYVLISGEKFHIPLFPIYSKCCFTTERHRAVDVLERASNALDALKHEEKLMALPSPVMGNFSGYSIWTVPKDYDWTVSTDYWIEPADYWTTPADLDRCQEHPGLVFRIDEEDLELFGPRAESTEIVAEYVKGIFVAMITLFRKGEDPSLLPVVRDYPEVKILERIWLDARQHVEKEENVPANKSAKQVRHRDIQEAIDKLSEPQRLRLLGIARQIPVRIPVPPREDWQRE